MTKKNRLQMQNIPHLRQVCNFPVPNNLFLVDDDNSALNNQMIFL